MKGRSYSPKGEVPERIEVGMKWISLMGSLSSLALMISGFVLMFLSESAFYLPGIPALPIGDLVYRPPGSLYKTLMSLGIVLLGLLPSARLLLAIGVYLFSRDLKSVVVGLIVLLELMLSLSLSI